MVDIWGGMSVWKISARGRDAHLDEVSECLVGEGEGELLLGRVEVVEVAFQ